MQPIPMFDLRNAGPAAHAAKNPRSVKRLRDACLRPAPGWALGLLRPVDAVERRWIARTGSPYGRDIAEIEASLGLAGVVAINMSYQYGCTTGVAPGRTGAPRMRRVLDWPFDGLGEAVEIHHLSGPAGDYFSVGWPGAVGVLTGMAPGRFCAAINQAPMRRRLRPAAARPLDIAMNLANTLLRETGWPPDHLLRHAFENCATFEAAMALLVRIGRAHV